MATKAERWGEIHEEALKRNRICQSNVREERDQSVQDRRFYSIAGAMWEDELGQQFENKPRFEINKIMLSVIRVINEYRNNRISVDFTPTDGGEDALADTLDGLYRADANDSSGEEAVDNAFEEAVGGGYGAWRLRTEYEDEYDPDNERQRIRFEPIFDADSSVFFDTNAKKQDMSDAKFCFVITALSEEEYKEEYDDDPASWPKDINDDYFDWYRAPLVFIAEYYRVEEQNKKLLYFEGLQGEEERHYADELTDEKREELAATGFKEVSSRRVKKRKIRKYTMSGGGVLDECDIAGKNIPIIPTYGKRWFVDNIERFMGHVRLAKDPNRLLNMQVSRLAETAALSPIEKPIVTPEQIAGNEARWANDNINNYPYQVLNPVTDAEGNEVATGPVGYTKAPQVPPALAATIQLTDQYTQDILGRQEQGEELQSNISGKAVELIQNRLDMQSFIYISNLAKAIRRCGEIWLSMAQELYDEPGRLMKTIGAQGEKGSVELMRDIEVDGVATVENDLSNAKFEVDVTVGPTSTSARASTVRSITGLMTLTQDPESLKVLTAMAMMNMEGEGIEEIREYYRKVLVEMGVIEPTEEDIAEAQAQAAKPNPQQQVIDAITQKEQSEAMRNMADTEKKVAEVDKTKAQTVEILADIEEKENEQFIRSLDNLMPTGTAGLN